MHDFLKLHYSCDAHMDIQKERKSFLRNAVNEQFPCSEVFTKFLRDTAVIMSYVKFDHYQIIFTWST